MKFRNLGIAAALLVAASCSMQAQVKVTRDYATPKARFATSIWAGDTLYVAGQMASPVTPEDKAKGTPAVYGDTEAQATSVFKKLDEILKAQGLTLADIVQMDIFCAPDPNKGNKMDFDGVNAAYAKFFGTADQPARPVRAAVQVAGLSTPWGLVEIQVVADKPAK